jgi:hypothetical protein
MRRSSSRAIRTRALCSARVRRAATRVCQLLAVRARGGISVLAPEVVQMPAQVVAQRGALRDEPLAVIDEQSDVELRAGQLRDWQAVEAFAQRGAGDRDGIDEV